MRVVIQRIIYIRKYLVLVGPEVLYWVLMSCIWGRCLFELYLCLRQTKVLVYSVPNDPEAPVINKIVTPEIFEKQRTKGISLSKLYILTNLWEATPLTAILHFGILAELWNFIVGLTTFPPAPLDEANEENPKSPDSSSMDVIRNGAFAVLVFIMCVFMLAPFFHRWIFPKGSYSPSDEAVCIGEVLTPFAVILTLFQVFCMALYRFFGALARFYLTPEGLAHAEYIFFIYVCPILMLFFLLQHVIYPAFIKTCWNLVKRKEFQANLQNGSSLRSGIEALADRTGFPLAGITVSRATSNSCQDTGVEVRDGYSGKKWIILKEGVIKDLDAEEIEAAVAQIIGKWHQKSFEELTDLLSPLKQLMGAFLFVIFYNNRALTETFGFPSESENKPLFVPVVVALFGLQIVLRPVFLITDYIERFFSRRSEFQADAFAANLGYCDSLKNMLIKVNNNNCKSISNFPIFDSTYAAWYYKYPSLLERIDSIDKVNDKTK